MPLAHAGSRSTPRERQTAQHVLHHPAHTLAQILEPALPNGARVRSVGSERHDHGLQGPDGRGGSVVAVRRYERHDHRDAQQRPVARRHGAQQANERADGPVVWSTSTRPGRIVVQIVEVLTSGDSGQSLFAVLRQLCG